MTCLLFCLEESATVTMVTTTSHQWLNTAEVCRNCTDDQDQRLEVRGRHTRNRSGPRHVLRRLGPVNLQDPGHDHHGLNCTGGHFSSETQCLVENPAMEGHESVSRWSNFLPKRNNLVVAQDFPQRSNFSTPAEDRPSSPSGVILNSC